MMPLCWQSGGPSMGTRMTRLRAQVDGVGNVTMRFTGPPGASAGAGCSAGVRWPQLDGLVLLGAGAVDPASLTMQARSRCAPGHTEPGQGSAWPVWCCRTRSVFH